MREFNIAGLCNPKMHYMVEISDKIKTIKKLVDGGKYFTINRARQYGKTTIMYMLQKELINEYTVISTSFEGIGGDVFKEEKEFSSRVFKIFSDDMRFQDKELVEEIKKVNQNIESIEDLSNAITELCLNSKKKIVLMIDEVDKSSDNQMFLHFIGMLRNKYLDRNAEKDYTFHSVILAGVHDVKNLKLKLRPEDERKYNSPWNIAVDFNVDMSFNPKEISTMLVEYENDHKTGMNIAQMSEDLYYYTSGYPFLVSKLCKLMDENLDKRFTKEGLQEAVKMMLKESNTLFDDLIKNLENNEDLYNAIYKILVEGENIDYSIDNPVLNKAIMFSIIKDVKNRTKIHNKIFEARIYNYMISKKQTSNMIHNYASESQFIKEDGTLYMERILEKFQELMYQEYRQKDEKFIEREGRLLFLTFLKPIINGIGFYDVETETRNSQRMDIVVTYGKARYVIELKIWRGQKYEEAGHKQLAEYLEIKQLDEGYMLVFDFRKGKEYTDKWMEVEGKKIYEVVV
ncbi:MAG TPA: AAA family ATPase [Clostridiales bacterium]|nr:MAG: AAA family ATPase [Clostridiales bacterium GWD2_32_59]HAN09510.1 AAA family ATPase [Clostridiales bacterium]